MKKILLIVMFTLAMLGWAAAQQAGSVPSQSTRPDSSQSPQQTPDSAGQSQSQAPDADVPVTEGCLNGGAPNYTITDKDGTTYKLNFSANKDMSKLAAHVGEPVRVMGNVNDASKTGNASIDVQGIGAGTGTCPASDSKGEQSPPKR